MLEAETFPTRTAGAIVSDASASGGKAWSSGQAASISSRWFAEHHGTYRIWVVARGVAQDGVFPQMSVFVDGRAVGHFWLNETYGSYRMEDTVALGERDIRIFFSNPSTTRAIFVDFARIEILNHDDPLPIWREVESFPTKTTGAQSTDARASAGRAWNLWSNGYARTEFCASVLWRDSFASSPWTTPWKIASSWGMSNTEVVRTGTNATFLRVTYPAGSVGEGAEWKAKPVAPRDALHLQYKVRFPTDFDFVRGGKLPGLFGGVGNSGGNIPDGTDGWSTRLMWRSDGKGEAYAYLPTSQTWGTRLGTGSWNFTADGQWHTVEQGVVLNTPGSRNGEITIWYDGVKVLHATGLTFRTVGTLKADGIFFSTFFGGNDETWATPETVHADFADFALSTSYIGR